MKLLNFTNILLRHPEFSSGSFKIDSETSSEGRSFF